MKLDMLWMQDRYVVSAGDVAAAYSSRGFNLALGRWETLPGTNMTPYGGEVPFLRLRHVEARAWHAGGSGITGVLFWLGASIDQKRPGELITLPIHSGNIHSVVQRAIVWQGDLPLGGGVVWRISKGGLIAGDYVTIAIGYERQNYV